MPNDAPPARPAAAASVAVSTPAPAPASSLDEGPDRGPDGKPDLILGPALRHVDTSSATIWVETTARATVVIRAGENVASAQTFAVEGHHYALVVLEGLAPGIEQAYDVTLDERPVWPQAADHRPAPSIRTLPLAGQEAEHDLDIVFGSCRVDRPHEPPYTLEPEQHPDGVGVDALSALSLDCQAGRRRLPDLLLMLGDQVYADEGLSPAVLKRRAARRAALSGPVDGVQDFQEYTWLYHDTWSDPEVRWLLSTVPSAMVFDDHDVCDDWNTSEVWRRETHRLPWWPERIAGAYMSYWIYQHLGNLSPSALAGEGLLRKVTEAEDSGAVLRAFAETADDEVDGEKRSHWSYCRDLGRARLVVVDTRSGRVLEDGHRDMLDEGEWRVVEGWIRGDVDHLVIASSLPLILEGTLHDIEQWNEALCAGGWGRRIARRSERLRQALDLEHWAAFSRSFRRLVSRLGEVAAGRQGRAPASVLVLSGDVHHSYVAPLRFPSSVGATTSVVQVVSSPLRNAFPRRLQRAFRLGDTRSSRVIGAVLRRAARVPGPDVEWSLTTGPLFGNGLGSVRLSGRTALVRLERAVPGPAGPTLRVAHQQKVTPAGAEMITVP